MLADGGKLRDSPGHSIKCKWVKLRKKNWGFGHVVLGRAWTICLWTIN